MQFILFIMYVNFCYVRIFEQNRDGLKLDLNNNVSLFILGNFANDRIGRWTNQFCRNTFYLEYRTCLICSGWGYFFGENAIKGHKIARLKLGTAADAPCFDLVTAGGDSLIQGNYGQHLLAGKKCRLEKFAYIILHPCCV